MSDSSSPLEHVSTTIVCYVPSMVTTNGVWQGDDPLEYSLPLFVLQITLMMVIINVLIFILKPLRPPRIVAEMLGGLIMGPTLFGRFHIIHGKVFAPWSTFLTEIMANVGLQYFVFLVGVEMDLSVIKRSGKKAASIAIGSMTLPFVISYGFSIFLLGGDQDAIKSAHQPTYMLFLAISLAVTTFPGVARVLVEFKLINTEIGQIAMSSSLVNDITAWILLALAIALSGTSSNHLISLWVILSNIIFVAFCFFIIRPILMWIIRRTPNGEPINNLYLCLIVIGVMVSGLITDLLGTHYVIGAFVFGLIIPNEPLGITLIEKLDDFVSNLLLPMFFFSIGFKTNIFGAILEDKNVMNLFLIIVLAYIGKITGTVAVSYFYNLPLSEGITLGLLMNTKGLVELIVLNIGHDEQVLDDNTFSIMVVATLFMTTLVGPLVNSIYRSTRRLFTYKRRTLQSIKPDSELPILCCIHTQRNIPTMINLLEATHPTRRSPLCVFVLHLIELTGRASAMLIVHNTQKSVPHANSLNRTQAQSDHIFKAFESYEQQEPGCVTIQPLTAISPYSSMHEDICNFAEDKRVTFIIIPFHKQQTVDGGMESTNPAFQTLNQNMLANAPCSIGILVDRGLNGSSTHSGLNQVSHHVVVLFFSGPDDREALAYSLRMLDNPATYVTVMRFLPGPNVSGTNYMVSPTQEPGNSRVLTTVIDVEYERQLDEEYLNDFRAKTAGNRSITYEERVVNNGDETLATIRSIGSTHDLYIVGRGQGMISPLLASLTDWSECPELGAIGDLLASSDFAASISVLVVKQYVGLGGTQATEVGGVVGPNSPFAANGAQVDFDDHLNLGDGYKMSNQRNR